MQSSEEISIVLGLTCVATCAVLVVQMEFGRQRARDLLAPVPFLLGYLTAISYGNYLMGGSVAFVSFVAIIGTRSLTSGYLLSGIAAGVLGYPFFGLGANLGIFALTALAPVPYAFYAVLDWWFRFVDRVREGDTIR